MIIFIMLFNSAISLLMRFQFIVLLMVILRQILTCNNVKVFFPMSQKILYNLMIKVKTKLTIGLEVS